MVARRYDSTVADQLPQRVPPCHQGSQDIAPRIAATEPAASVNGLVYHHAVDAYRKRLILNALSETRGNRTAAAKLLGLERSYLLRLMRSFGIN